MSSGRNHRRDGKEGCENERGKEKTHNFVLETVVSSRAEYIHRSLHIYFNISWQSDCLLSDSHESLPHPWQLVSVQVWVEGKEVLLQSKESECMFKLCLLCGPEGKVCLFAIHVEHLYFCKEQIS